MGQAVAEQSTLREVCRRCRTRAVCRQHRTRAVRRAVRGRVCIGRLGQHPDAEYNRELVQQRPAQDEQPFKPITIARTHSSRRSTQRPSDDYDDDDDYGDDSTGSYEYAEDPESECELDEYEEYALETGADEPLNDSEQDHAGHTASKYPPPQSDIEPRPPNTPGHPASTPPQGRPDTQAARMRRMNSRTTPAGPAQ